VKNKKLTYATSLASLVNFLFFRPSGPSLSLLTLGTIGVLIVLVLLRSEQGILFAPLFFLLFIYLLEKKRGGLEDSSMIKIECILVVLVGGAQAYYFYN
jgi:hypothetical protein